MSFLVEATGFEHATSWSRTLNRISKQPRKGLKTGNFAPKNGLFTGFLTSLPKSLPTKKAAFLPPFCVFGHANLRHWSLNPHGSKTAQNVRSGS